MEKYFFTVAASLFTIGVVINLVVLNYTVFRLLPTRLELIQSQVAPTVVTTSSDQPSTEKIQQSDACGAQCQIFIQEALRATDRKIATLAAQPVQKSIIKQTPIPTTIPIASVKEFFVPMGSGHTTSAEWEDVAGSDVYINTANFPSMQTVYFEASLRIPTKNGVVSARLYNVSDKHPVWNSDVSTDQDKSTFVASSFTFDTGNKQYRVQMKTSLQYDSLLDSARIKILTK